MKLTRLLLIVCLGFFIAADKAKDMTDQEKIQGTWILVSAQSNGKALPDDVVKNVRLVFAENKLKTKNKDRVTEATFKLSQDKKPREIDLELNDGVGRGIYALEGDDLKIIHGEVDQERPTEFVSKPDSKLILLILKREKPDESKK
jgi:uncharacterized protein (TIGR03067 family)